MRWSLIKAADEFGVARETIRKGLIHNEVEVGPGKTYTTREIYAAIAGDLKYERTRQVRAEADAAEVEAALAKREVIKRDDVTQFIRSTFAPVREDVIALPGFLAAKCNPGNPEQARQALIGWVDQFIARRREHLPEEPENEKD